MLIDTSFDFRTDTPPGRDPDADSPTLRRYHKLLWSKVLPNGALFDLNDAKRGVYLHHRSELGEFFLSSDSAIATFTRWGFAKVHPELYTDEDNEAFMAIAYTIGGMMVFPGNRIDGKWTINQARGCLRKISDRLDLTLECVRRHYAGQSSPLGGTLARYSDFFALFKDFRGYVDFFLLQELVTDDCSAVTFFMPFDDFKTSSVTERRRYVPGVPTPNYRVCRGSQPSNRPTRGPSRLTQAAAASRRTSQRLHRPQPPV